MSLIAVTGPSNPGPGEREEMLEAARQALLEEGIEPADIVRIDVPGRGAGEDGEGTLRAELEPVVPILQSGSLFGGRQGLLVVDAHNLQVAEAEILADLVSNRDPEAVAVVFVSGGKLPKPLADVAKNGGRAVTIAKMWERQAIAWAEEEMKKRELDAEPEAAAALVQRFGTDTAAMSRALDQLREHRGKITPALILDWFKNRPDEPLFLYIDAIEKGRAGEALRFPDPRPSAAGDRSARQRPATPGAGGGGTRPGDARAVDRSQAVGSEGREAVEEPGESGRVGPAAGPGGDPEGGPGAEVAPGGQPPRDHGAAHGGAVPLVLVEVRPTAGCGDGRRGGTSCAPPCWA